CEDWGFSVWAHNSCTREEFIAELTKPENGFSAHEARLMWTRLAGSKDAPAIPASKAQALFAELTTPKGRGDATRANLKKGKALEVLDRLRIPRPPDVEVTMPKTTVDGTGKTVEVNNFNIPGKDFQPKPGITEPFDYGAITPTTAQKQSVQGRPCVVCGGG